MCLSVRPFVFPFLFACLSARLPVFLVRLTVCLSVRSSLPPSSRSSCLSAFLLDSLSVHSSIHSGILFLWLRLLSFFMSVAVRLSFFSASTSGCLSLSKKKFSSVSLCHWTLAQHVHTVVTQCRRKQLKWERALSSKRTRNCGDAALVFGGGSGRPITMTKIFVPTPCHSP